MSQYILEKYVLEVFDKAIISDTIQCNLYNFDNDFKYLFPTITFSVHNIDQRLLLTNIDRDQ